MGILLLLLFVVLIVGALPRWGYSQSWGYRPSSGLGIVLVILLILMFMGHLPYGF